MLNICCVFMNNKPSLIFFIFWLLIFSLTVFDSFAKAVQIPNLQVIVVKQAVSNTYRTYLGGHIWVKEKDLKRYYELDAGSTHIIRVGDKVTIHKSPLFGRTKAISGQNFYFSTSTMIWNPVILTMMLISTTALLGCIYFYLKKYITQNSSGTGTGINVSDR